MNHGTPPSPSDELGDLLTPAEVAAMFRVDPKTVTRWSTKGRLPSAVRTIGGHRRYRRSDIDAMRTDPDLRIILRMPADELKAAADMLVKVIASDFSGPLTDDECAPLLALLRAIGGEAK